MTFSKLLNYVRRVRRNNKWGYIKVAVISGRTSEMFLCAYSPLGPDEYQRNRHETLSQRSNVHGIGHWFPPAKHLNDGVTQANLSSRHSCPNPESVAAVWRGVKPGHLQCLLECCDKMSTGKWCAININSSPGVVCRRAKYTKTDVTGHSASPVLPKYKVTPAPKGFVLLCQIDVLPNIRDLSVSQP